MEQAPNRPAVLVTDGMQRKSLAAVRALGRSGERVVAAEWTAFAAALFSRFAERARMEHGARGEAIVARSVGRICRDRGVDVVLAMEESTLLALLRNPRELPSGTVLPFPALKQVEWARDKLAVVEAASGLGLRVPVTTSDSGRINDFSLPAVVKPRTSSGAVGVRYADTRAELAAAYEDVAGAFPCPLIQERLQEGGEGVGVSVFMGEGGVAHAVFTHRRLREYPVRGGASTLRESCHEPEAEEAALALLRYAGWRGVAMVEFKRDLQDGSLKLLEVNPRFWGSLALAVAAGVNFPLMLVRWARGLDPGPKPRYRAGVRCRWLIPGDILHFAANPRRMRLEPPFFRFREGDLFYDDIDPGDPMPVLGTMLSAVPFLLDPASRRFLRR